MLKLKIFLFCIVGTFVICSIVTATEKVLPDMRIIFHGIIKQEERFQTGMAFITPELGLSNILSNVSFIPAGGELSPDGLLVAYDNCTEINRGLYIAQINGGNIQEVRQFEKSSYFAPGTCISIRWSPDGSKLSYKSPEDGLLHIFEISSKKDFTLPDTANTDGLHSWSPTGKEIVYGKIVGDGIALGLLYITDLTHNGRQLTSTNDFESCRRGDSNLIDIWDPKWSPIDSDMLAFISCGDLFTISPNGKNLRQLTSTKDSYNPRWSSDGKWILFLRSDNSRHILWGISKEGDALMEIGKLPSYYKGKDPSVPFPLVSFSVGSLILSEEEQKSLQEERELREAGNSEPLLTDEYQLYYGRRITLKPSDEIKVARFWKADYQVTFSSPSFGWKSADVGYHSAITSCRDVTGMCRNDWRSGEKSEFWLYGPSSETAVVEITLRKVPPLQK